MNYEVVAVEPVTGFAYERVFQDEQNAKKHIEELKLEGYDSIGLIETWSSLNEMYKDIKENERNMKNFNEILKTFSTDRLDEINKKVEIEIKKIETSEKNEKEENKNK